MSEETPQEIEEMGEAVEDNRIEQHLSEEEEQAAAEMTAVAEITSRLMQNDSRYSKLVASMLASRQLYAMCLYELERLVGDTDFKKATKLEGEEDLDVGKQLSDQQAGMLKEILINSAAVQAQQPFEETHLFNGMMSTVFPWMQDIVKIHNELQAEQRKKQFEEAEKERVARKIAFDTQIFPAEGKDDGYWLTREKSLLFVGWEPALRWLMDHITIAALKEGNNVHQVLRLIAGGAPVYKDERIWHLPKNAWAGCAESNDGFQRIYAAGAMENLVAQVDLLIVDDLSNSRKGASFLTPVSQANEAQKKFKNWAKDAGCLLVGCLPYDRQLKANELNLPDYETLRMHNVLRGVVAEQTQVDGQKYYKIMVGQYEVSRVPVDAVHAYKQSKIIKP